MSEKRAVFVPVAAEQDYAHYSCHSCGKEVKVLKWDDPEYWFYQVKKIGAMKYVIDYAFCSKDCMSKYLKKKEQNSR